MAMLFEFVVIHLMAMDEVGTGTARDCHGFINLHGLQVWVGMGAGVGLIFGTLRKPAPAGMATWVTGLLRICT